jgi:hypothetical protein
MGRVRKINKDYTGLDRHSINGAFTVPNGKKMDMLGLREYCKSEKIKYGDLAEKEIRRFEK